MRLDTSCENCVFATQENNCQTGCLVGALDGFSSANAEIEDLPIEDKVWKKVKNRVCMYRRYPDWGTSDEIQKVKAEVVPPINFLIKHTGEDLESTLYWISQVPSEKIKVIVAYNTKNTNQIKSLVWKYIPPEKAYFSLILDERPDFDMFLDEGFKLVSNGYTCLVNSGFLVPLDIVDKINNLVNVQMKRVALIKGKPTVINNMIFKALGRNVGAKFEAKLEENLGKDMVFEWGVNV